VSPRQRATHPGASSLKIAIAVFRLAFERYVDQPLTTICVPLPVGSLQIDRVGFVTAFCDAYVSSGRAVGSDERDCERL